MGRAGLGQLGHEVIVADPNFAPMYATRHEALSAQNLALAATVAPVDWMLDSTNEQLAKLRRYLADSPRHTMA